MSDVSVFGATGFVGSCFRQNSLHKVHAVPREERKTDLSEILYLISTTHNYHVFDDVHKDIDVNLTVLVDVLKNLRPSKSVFNFVSSWFVYGDTQLPAHEGSACHPKGFYSITKHAAEQLVASYCQTFGVDYRILRLSNIYGPGDQGVSAKKNALQFLVEKLKNNEEIPLYHDGHFYRDYLHVEDLVRALDVCLREAPLNEVINIGSGKKTLFRDMMCHAREYLGSSSEFKPVEPPHFHQVVQVKDFYMTTDKLQALGFAPKIDIYEGIQTLCR